MMRSRYYGLWKAGNTKLSMQTLIFNMTSATHCPSRKLGMCQYCKVCYAKGAEIQYPNTLAYRKRQRKYWNKNGLWEIMPDIQKILKKRKIKYFRFNEAGDFQNQRDVNLLDLIAERLKRNYGIITYGYTARSDLDYSGYAGPLNFLVKGSNWDGPNGRTTVMHKKFLKRINPDLKKAGWKICPGKDCGTKCKLCMQDNKTNIIFPLHGRGFK